MPGKIISTGSYAPKYQWDIEKKEPRPDHKAKMKIDDVLKVLQNINTDNELEEIEEELTKVKMIIDAEMQVTEDSEGSHENKYGKPVITEVRKSYLEDG